MSLISRLMAWLYKLPPAETHDITVVKGLEIPMHDGVVLRADHYYPSHRADQPTCLIRTPYGRANYGRVMGWPLAERGFQVVIQSCRGTDDSEGEVVPFRGEREDGLATLDWLKKQDWFDGRLGMAGPSYIGFTQWALAAEAGPELKAISTQVISSEMRSVMYPGGSFNLEIFLQWMMVTHSIRGSIGDYFRDLMASGRRQKAGVEHLPLMEVDEIVLNQPVGFWRDWMNHADPEDAWWAREDYSQKVTEVSAPNHLISGWFDFMLPQLLRDYETLYQAGRNPYLTIGPWSHSSNGLSETGIREALVWLRAHLHGEREHLRPAPVRIYVVGADEWRDLDKWPPADAHHQTWYLQPHAGLSMEMPAESQPSRFTYDPAQPTPNVGGPTNAPLGRGTGPQDNRQLEARPDVLTFTSPYLPHDLEVMGPVVAELYIQSNLEHTDFFVRLCDVQPEGKSLNVCDGILRLDPERPLPEEDGCRHLRVDLWPTAYRFKRGHCLRVQLSSGAFPRYPRNLGTGEPLGTGVGMLVAEQQVFHDPMHPSCICLHIS